MNPADPYVAAALLAALRLAIQARDGLLDECDLIYAPPPSDAELWERAKGAFLKALPASTR